MAYGRDVLGASNANGQRARMRRVSAGPAQPGDLVFFGTLSSTYHVGVFIGGGQMVDAPFTGALVRVDQISTHRNLLGYYRL
jgi:cell wall-associated NlpC family hydrolase